MSESAETQERDRLLEIESLAWERLDRYMRMWGTICSDSVMSALDKILLPAHYVRSESSSSSSPARRSGRASPSSPTRGRGGKVDDVQIMSRDPSAVNSEGVFSSFDDGSGGIQTVIAQHVSEHVLGAGVSQRDDGLPMLQLIPYFEEIIKIEASLAQREKIVDDNVQDEKTQLFGDTLLFKYFADHTNLNKVLVPWFGPALTNLIYHHPSSSGGKSSVDDPPPHSSSSFSLRLLSTMSKSALAKKKLSRRKSSYQELQKFLRTSLKALNNSYSSAGGAIDVDQCTLLHSRERYPWLVVMNGDILTAGNDQSSSSSSVSPTTGAADWSQQVPECLTKAQGFTGLRTVTTTTTSSEGGGDTTMKKKMVASSYIVKSNDDARQELLAVQLVKILNKHLKQVDLTLFLEPLTSPDGGKKKKKKKKTKGKSSSSESDDDDDGDSEEEGEELSFSGLEIPIYDVSVYKMDDDDGETVAAEEGELLQRKLAVDRLGKEEADDFGAIIEVVPDAASLHAIRRNLREEHDPEDHKGNKSGSEELAEVFEEMLVKEFFKKKKKSSSATDSVGRQRQINCLKSLLASAVVSYVLKLRDRHNANILINTQGQLINVDFGFFLERAPGGESFSLECDSFRLMEEFSNIFFRGSDKKSKGWLSFKRAFIRCIHVLREEGGAMAEIFAFLARLDTKVSYPTTSSGGGKSRGITSTTLWSKLLCTNGLSPREVIDDLSDRALNVSDSSLDKACDKAFLNSGSAKYDRYQWKTNDIR